MASAEKQCARRPGWPNQNPRCEWHEWQREGLTEVRRCGGERWWHGEANDAANISGISLTLTRCAFINAHRHAAISEATAVPAMFVLLGWAGACCYGCIAGALRSPMWTLAGAVKLGLGARWIGTHRCQVQKSYNRSVPGRTLPRECPDPARQHRGCSKSFGPKF